MWLKWCAVRTNVCVSVFIQIDVYFEYFVCSIQISIDKMQTNRRFRLNWKHVHLSKTGGYHLMGYVKVDIYKYQSNKNVV